jgi:hypothetical protein
MPWIQAESEDRVVETKANSTPRAGVPIQGNRRDASWMWGPTSLDKQPKH